jgi:hypothetical protein
MPIKLGPTFARAEQRGAAASCTLVRRLARSTSLISLLLDPPREFQMLTRAEREQVLKLRVRIRRTRIGPCEHRLRLIGRWMDAFWSKITWV